MIANPHLRRKAGLVLLILLAFGARMLWLNGVPPGWRDDELINSLVISQKALDGDWQLYYPDASGHEGLYHLLNALFLGIFGRTVLGVRWLSAILGTLTVPLTYQMGVQLFGRRHKWAAATAALGLTFSFWGLMYARIGLRHVALPVFALMAFYAFWRMVTAKDRAWRWGASAGLGLGVGFYTYFASRGVPLVPLAFVGYVALVDWGQFKRKLWRPTAVMLVVALVSAVPLVLTLQAQPEAEARVAELAAPVVQAQAGDFSLLGEHIWRTLSMFHSDGDDEYLYNIPFRPLFGLVGAVFFWLGVALCAWCAITPLWRRGTAERRAFASAFLLLWWLAGIAPGFLSVPAASLGHTILAQPAVYLLAAVPLWFVPRPWARWGVPLLAMLLVGSIAGRDLPAYFVEWPHRGNVRLLYRADLKNVAQFLAQSPHAPRNFGITGLLAGPWDRIALEMELAEAGVVARPRWFNSERVVWLEPSLVFMGYPTTLGNIAPENYAVAQGVAGYDYVGVVSQLIVGADERSLSDSRCFANGLCAPHAVYQPETGELRILWRVAKPLLLPAVPLISNPPPPGVATGPRLQVFAHLLDAQGNILAGDDGLWVDAQTLQVGDLFRQVHFLRGEGQVVRFGLYDPRTGERVLTRSGADGVTVTSAE